MHSLFQWSYLLQSLKGGYRSTQSHSKRYFLPNTAVTPLIPLSSLCWAAVLTGVFPKFHKVSHPSHHSNSKSGKCHTKYFLKHKYTPLYVAESLALPKLKGRCSFRNILRILNLGRTILNKIWNKRISAMLAPKVLKKSLYYIFIIFTLIPC